jgi:hypothetical protein
MKEAKANKYTYLKVKEGSKLTLLPLIIVALASIVIGYFTSEAFIMKHINFITLN